MLGSAKLVLVFSILVATLLAGCASTHQTASLSISIVDAAGSYPIPGIEIVATAKATGQVSRGTTDSQGRVSFSGLPIGDYSLASPTFGTSENVFLPDHVQYRGGIQQIRVRADLSTDKKGIYVKPGSAA